MYSCCLDLTRNSKCLAIDPRTSPNHRLENNLVVPALKDNWRMMIESIDMRGYNKYFLHWQFVPKGGPAPQKDTSHQPTHVHTDGPPTYREDMTVKEEMKIGESLEGEEEQTETEMKMEVDETIEKTEDMKEEVPETEEKGKSPTTSSVESDEDRWFLTWTQQSCTVSPELFPLLSPNQQASVSTQMNQRLQPRTYYRTYETNGTGQQRPIQQQPQFQQRARANSLDSVSSQMSYGEAPFSGVINQQQQSLLTLEQQQQQVEYYRSISAQQAQMAWTMTIQQHQQHQVQLQQQKQQEQQKSQPIDTQVGSTTENPKESVGSTQNMPSEGTQAMPSMTAPTTQQNSFATVEDYRNNLLRLVAYHTTAANACTAQLNTLAQQVLPNVMQQQQQKSQQQPLYIPTQGSQSAASMLPKPPMTMNKPPKESKKSPPRDHVVPTTWTIPPISPSQYNLRSKGKVSDEEEPPAKRCVDQRDMIVEDNLSHELREHEKSLQASKPTFSMGLMNAQVPQPTYTYAAPDQPHAPSMSLEEKQTPMTAVGMLGATPRESATTSSVQAELPVFIAPQLPSSAPFQRHLEEQMTFGDENSKEESLKADTTDEMEVTDTTAKPETDEKPNKAKEQDSLRDSLLRQGGFRIIA
eukprot:TRINITY_DN543457_c0_g1_i1.p1 TRINITY_DN543457_c0_g1~~TRINITY_DN543457_c0_g1_i1.p1  ORF type:complete len:655 (-),score=208.53 TRINITY_DN543457_c0_g1_i1:144-2057(-)